MKQNDGSLPYQQLSVNLMNPEYFSLLQLQDLNLIVKFFVVFDHHLVVYYFFRFCLN